MHWREEMRRMEGETLHRVDQLIPNQHVLLTSISELKDQYFTLCGNLLILVVGVSSLERANAQARRQKTSQAAKAAAGWRKLLSGCWVGGWRGGGAAL